MCVCDEIFVRVDGSCTKDNTVRINDIHVESTFFPVYNNVHGVEFLKLSEKISTMIIESVRKIDGRAIRSVRVFNPRAGSVIVDSIVAYYENSTYIEAYEEFKEAINAMEKPTTSADRIYVKSNKVPVLVPQQQQQQLEVVDYVVTVVVVVVTLCVIVAAFVAVCLYVRRKKMSAKHAGVSQNHVEVSENGRINKGLELNNVGI